jgi:hypothetical protein
VEHAFGLEHIGYELEDLAVGKLACIVLGRFANWKWCCYSNRRQFSPHDWMSGNFPEEVDEISIQVPPDGIDIEVTVFSRWKGTTFLYRKYHVQPFAEGESAEISELS